MVIFHLGNGQNGSVNGRCNQNIVQFQIKLLTNVLVNQAYAATIATRLNLNLNHL